MPDEPEKPKPRSVGRATPRKPAGARKTPAARKSVMPAKPRTRKPTAKPDLVETEPTQPAAKAEPPAKPVDEKPADEAVPEPAAPEPEPEPAPEPEPEPGSGQMQQAAAPHEAAAATEPVPAQTSMAKLSAAAQRSRLDDAPAEAGGAKPDPIMVVDGLTRSFGGLTAVDIGHLEIQRGVITGLIGPNGAGKTTLFNLLTGFDRPDTGGWTFEGAAVHRPSPHKVARRGVVRTFQLTKALAKLTVLDNMRLGAPAQSGESFIGALVTPWWRQEREVTEKAHELLVRFQLQDKANDLAGSLSGGQRKLLEIARALMMDPIVVMLDEPMAGVNPALTQRLLGHVKSLRDDGMTVVFVEHDMDVIRDVSDWVVVMAQGSVIAEGPPDELSSNRAVVDAYLGAHHDRPLEFDAAGNPVGQTAELMAEMERVELEELAEPGVSKTEGNDR